MKLSPSKNPDPAFNPYSKSLKELRQYMSDKQNELEDQASTSCRETSDFNSSTQKFVPFRNERDRLGKLITNTGSQSDFKPVIGKGPALARSVTSIKPSNQKIEQLDLFSNSALEQIKRREMIAKSKYMHLDRTPSPESDIDSFVFRSLRKPQDILKVDKQQTSVGSTKEHTEQDTKIS